MRHRALRDGQSVWCSSKYLLKVDVLLETGAAADVVVEGVGRAERLEQVADWAELLLEPVGQGGELPIQRWATMDASATHVIADVMSELDTAAGLLPEG